MSSAARLASRALLRKYGWKIGDRVTLHAKRSDAVVVGNTLWETAHQRHIPRHALSRVSAYDWLASVAFIPLGFAIAGPLSTVVGIPELLYFGAAFNTTAALALLALPSVRTVRRK